MQTHTAGQGTETGGTQTGSEVLGAYFKAGTRQAPHPSYRPQKKRLD